MIFYKSLFCSSDVSCEVGNMLIKWVYTDHTDVRNDELVIIDLVKAANRYKLKALRTRLVNFFVFLFFHILHHFIVIFVNRYPISYKCCPNKFSAHKITFQVFFMLNLIVFVKGIYFFELFSSF